MREQILLVLRGARDASVAYAALSTQLGIDLLGSVVYLAECYRIAESELDGVVVVHDVGVYDNSLRLAFHIPYPLFRLDIEYNSVRFNFIK